MMVEHPAEKEINAKHKTVETILLIIDIPPLTSFNEEAKKMRPLNEVYSKAVSNATLRGMDA